MHKSKSPMLIALSIIAVLNIVFVPVFDLWGGLFPNDVDNNFFDVLEMFFEDMEDNWHHWVVFITIIILVPSLFMLFFSLTGARGLFTVSTIIGIILWFYMIMKYVSQYELSYLFDFEDGSIAIGTWIAVLLDLIALCVSISGWHKSADVKEIHTMPNFNPISIANKESQVNSKFNFCPQCGVEVNNSMLFCGKCGYKLKNATTLEKEEKN